MGDVVALPDLRARRLARRQTGTRPSGPIQIDFYFDLASPFIYLAAERVDRTFRNVTWIPAFRRLAGQGADLVRERTSADARAAALRLPLVWPEGWPRDVPGAMRAA